jgi:hypothetical protein
MTQDESNWLDSKTIECGQCGQKLHWLWHSPMYDVTFFYCTKCPKRVEVSYYDTFVIQLDKLVLKESNDVENTDRAAKYHALIEQHLAECECGGRFEYAASRRCLKCFAVLPQSEPGRDVWPPESADGSLSLDYQSLSFPMESMVKSENIWRK